MQMRTLLSTSLLASLLASASFAAEAGTITGTVKNADGMPFRAAFVRVQNTKTRMTMMVASDRQGRYFTDELVPGAYQVWATSVGYKSDPSRRVSVTVDEKGRRTVDFTMQTSAVQWSQLTKFQAGVLLPEAEGNAKHVLIQLQLPCLRQDRGHWATRLRRLEGFDRRDAPHGRGPHCARDREPRGRISRGSVRARLDDAAVAGPAAGMGQGESRSQLFQRRGAQRRLCRL
jgi:hypothetical protein